MELSLSVVVNIMIGIVVGVPVLLGFLGISWLRGLRIAVAMAIGAVLLGFLAWPLVKPARPLGAITLLTGDITFLDTITCIFLAYIASFIAYFVSYPLGRKIATLTAPTGLAVWAILTGNMTSLLNLNSSLAQHQALYNALRWEGFFWLIIIAAGYLGVLSADRIARSKPKPAEAEKNHKFNTNKLLGLLTACIVIVIITHFGVGIFAQDVKMFDSQIGSVVGQPEVGQIAFALIIAFGIAAFVAKKFLETDYVLSTIATALLTLFTITICANTDVLRHMVNTWPVAFFPRSTIAILPLQIVAFGATGSIAGYWMAVQYVQWRKQAKKQ